MRRTHWARACAAILLLTSFMGLSGASVTAHARANAPSISTAVVLFEPPLLKANAGGVVTASIVISGAIGLYGAEVHVMYDPSVVSDIAVGPSQPFAQGSLLTSQGAYFIAANEVNRATGVLTYAVTMISPSVPVTDSGTLVTIRFQNIKTGATALTFGSVQLADIDGQPIQHTVEAGRIIFGQVYLTQLPLVMKGPNVTLATSRLQPAAVSP